MNNKIFTSSREIAKFRKIKKDHINEDIINMIKQIYNICIPYDKYLDSEFDSKIFLNKIIIVRNPSGCIDEFLLDAEHTIILLSGYDANIRKKLVELILIKGESEKNLLTTIKDFFIGE